MPTHLPAHRMIDLKAVSHSDNIQDKENQELNPASMESVQEKEQEAKAALTALTSPASDHNSSVNSNGHPKVETTAYLHLLTECSALGLICFLVWLDEGILATVIPSISNHFQSFSALAWYAPSYLFGLCAFQLPFGRVYKDFPTRPTFLVSLLVFEVASIVQAAAPTSASFIIGRVIAGIGGAGVLTGALTILSQEISKPKLPLAIKGLSALDSGYRILPLLTACVLFNFSAAALAGKLGYYHPFMIFGSIALTLGTAFLTTLTPESSTAKWAALQVIAGMGAGSGGQLPLIAVQDALAKTDVPIGYAVALSSGYLGPTAALAIVQAVFGSILTSGLKGQDILGVDPNIVKEAGATSWRDKVPINVVDRVEKAYNHALTQSWYVVVALAGVSLLSLLGLKWKKLENQEKELVSTQGQLEDRPNQSDKEVKE
ncbi:MAG: hypothetical protein Q9160_009280 [Pyrenula sp. 1 TL-2023]